MLVKLLHLKRVIMYVANYEHSETALTSDLKLEDVRTNLLQ